MTPYARIARLAGLAAAALLPGSLAPPAQALPPAPTARYEVTLDGPRDSLRMTGRVRAPHGQPGVFGVAWTQRPRAGALPTSVAGASAVVFARAERYGTNAYLGGRNLLCPPEADCEVTLFEDGHGYLVFGIQYLPGSHVAHETVYLLAQGTFEDVRVERTRWRARRAPGRLALAIDRPDDSVATVDAAAAERTMSTGVLTVPRRSRPSLAVAGIHNGNTDQCGAVLRRDALPVAAQSCPGLGHAHALAAYPAQWSAAFAAQRGRPYTVGLLVADL